MAKLQRLAGSTSHVLTIFIQDSSSTVGAGLTGLAYNSSGLTCYYKRNTGTAAVAVTLANISTLGTYVSGGFAEVSAANLPGLYEFHPPDAAYAVGARSVVFLLKGATNQVPVPIEIELTAVDNQDATRFGLTNLDAAVSTRSSHSAASVWAVGTRTLSAFAFSVDVGTVGGATATVLTPPLAANLTQVGGQAIPTPRVAGVLIVDIGYALGEVVVTDSSTPDVNVIQWKGGTPNDLVSGKVDANATASLGPTAPANWINAAALDPDVTTEIQAGLATATALSTVGTTASAIKAKTDNLPGSPAAVGSAMTLQDGAITSAKVTVGTYTGVASGWIERMEQVWRRFFKPASRTPTQLRTFADNGTTVQTTQAISDDGSGTETQGSAS
jgi:hypothetical protein